MARAGTVVLATLMVVLVLGAADALDQARSRIENMTAAQRNEVAETLRRFDLQIPGEQQKSLRELDKKIGKLPADEKLHYLAVLRRYHNWLETLPETVKDSIAQKSPSERMAYIKSLTSKYPLPVEKTPYWIQFVDVSGGNPFELAAVFKIWQELTPAQRKEIEGLPPGGHRRERILELGRELKIPREIRPSDFRAEEWIPKVEAKIAELKGPMPISGRLCPPAEILSEFIAKKKQRAARWRRCVRSCFVVWQSTFTISRPGRPALSIPSD